MWERQSVKTFPVLRVGLLDNMKLALLGYALGMRKDEAKSYSYDSKEAIWTEERNYQRARIELPS